jgi:Phytanoyl-CoA dioxygenase (PhyH)
MTSPLLLDREPTAVVADKHLLTKELEQNGIVVLPNFLAPDQLAAMQASFAARLQRLRWNDVDGFETNETHRHFVQDLLTLDQAFLDAALHPTVQRVLREYIGESFELVEAKGWRSLPTRRDFHGWHGDSWYDQTRVDYIPREVKLAVYLTDVQSGEFNYIRGSHGKQKPRSVRNDEVKDVPAEQIVRVLGQAGTACLFDTSGIHRQGVPILERRNALFYNYHDPSVPLQQEDVDYYRYHPLLLNAAFLGNLTAEDRRILGFGNKTNFLPNYARKGKHGVWQRVMHKTYFAKLSVADTWLRVVSRLKKILRISR